MANAAPSISGVTRPGHHLPLEDAAFPTAGGNGASSTLRPGAAVRSEKRGRSIGVTHYLPG